MRMSEWKRKQECVFCKHMINRDKKWHTEGYYMRGECEIHSNEFYVTHIGCSDFERGDEGE